jgi:hypothetical protein
MTAKKRDMQRRQAPHRNARMWLAAAVALGMGATRAWADDDAAVAREFAKALAFSKAETARAVNERAWVFAQLPLPSGTRIISAVTTALEAPAKGAGTIAAPRVKLIIERSGKTLFTWSAAGAKEFGWTEDPLCDQGVSVDLAPVDLGGKQHVRLNVGCVAGEDCIHGSSTVFLFRVEPDASGAPGALKLAWSGPGDNNHPEGDCVEGGCDYSQTLAFALSGDGKNLMLRKTDTVAFEGGDRKAKKACHAHGPHTTTDQASYTLSDGGMKTFAGAAPEAPILDDAIAPAQAAQLARDAAKLDAGARHDFAVAANSRGHRLFEAGKCGDALPLFEAAAALDAKYGMPRYNAARCYALAGDAPRATRALGELKALGKSQQKRLAEAKKDEAFKGMWADPSFQQLFQ